MPNTFPTFTVAPLTGTETWVDDMKLDRAINGDVKTRAFFTEKKRAFVFKLELTYTERDTLETFYDANRTDPFYFTWQGDSVQRVCLFDGPPKLDYKFARVFVDIALVEQ